MRVSSNNRQSLESGAADSAISKILKGLLMRANTDEGKSIGLNPEDVQNAYNAISQIYNTLKSATTTNQQRGIVGQLIQDFMALQNALDTFPTAIIPDTCNSYIMRYVSEYTSYIRASHRNAEEFLKKLLEHLEEKGAETKPRNPQTQNTQAQNAQAQNATV